MAIQASVFIVPTMVTGASVTSSLELPGCFLNMYLQVPTMTGGFGADTQIFVQGSADNSTFYRYSLPLVNTATVGVSDFAVASSTTQRIVYIPNFAMRYLKLETTAVATNGISSNSQFKIICVSNQ